jgi:hypothetical protein
MDETITVNICCELCGAVLGTATLPAAATPGEQQAAAGGFVCSPSCPPPANQSQAGGQP